MWEEVLLRFVEGNNFIKLNPPATDEDILNIEKELAIRIPTDLRKMLLEFNGDNNFLFSTTQIIETNLEIRKLTCFMPLDCLLFFAGNGCGDYFGYPITEEGIKDWKVYIWEHESDDRVWKANGLKDAIEKYYTDKI